VCVMYSKPVIKLKVGKISSTVILNHQGEIAIHQSNQLKPSAL